MRLKRGVTIMAIVTEEFKSRAKEDLSKTIQRIESASQQLESQLRRYVPEVAKTDLKQASRLRQEIEAERQKHDSARAELTQRLREITELEIGAEFEQGQIEADVDVAVGDNLLEKLSGAEIVIKEGVIQEIRGA